ncbi:O-phospho-L-seryl-tRNA[Sec]:L-selenocysteinyl-tRNA synthase [Monocercomonoides exilis]|uniref:O-phospho-L-seryl-tRNA[Sec]:L-selenocysteinyl- tRNA synthase n=1 Tax=Monocercomonoides exilis TaxID=2049356 RepID=UPI0035599BFC|nr:O-phospho-L-seryl-tRNA[Sec]:L-selenocysteinyl-tRNA synthase [Monocercomonoides exilis]|eukprot:MONOS_2984.1-p1 / transcript=MONOS_2984.1 / gene=MONOS_2984 / organism=Monocercomonoides_exilis_PA203 / gene_product=O-phospho-L-seryl-tRNA[Sec]:L-selenocysteinyl-tRNA synthase / transcript_product=O-phospho-L-seryl-tRNA[Sec]:L-selenocysteinyl-tRNA synthase / location=Mono_scaffold00066:37614-39626(+) / protein_length=557 / sequence_SO=supercontig / SO=protein_coding / is_pseudo=false
MDGLPHLDQIVGGKGVSDTIKNAFQVKNKFLLTLISQRSIPEDGVNDVVIENILSELSMMDSNNFIENAGVGEREARIFSPIVAKRHFYMGHGIGRSGDFFAPQPKAAGSSLLVKLTNYFALDILHRRGFRCANNAIVLPLATGMCLTMVFLSLKSERPKAKYVITPRMDQKTCVKCIHAAGFIPCIVENKLEGDEVRTDIQNLTKKIEEIGTENIVCVMSVSSCFAPRAPDRVGEISKLCDDYNIPHIVNNAYGLQSNKIMNMLEDSARKGRVDAVVMSTDKNFLVPVGGTVLCSPLAPSKKAFSLRNPISSSVPSASASSTPSSSADVSTPLSIVERVSNLFPGRANISPLVDLFITLLSLGWKGYSDLCEKRKQLFVAMQERLKEVAGKHNERLLSTPHNPISMAISLSSFQSSPTQQTDSGKGDISEKSSETSSIENASSSSAPSTALSTSAAVEKPTSSSSSEITSIGSSLFLRCVSGCRTVDPLAPPKKKFICEGVEMVSGFGSHLTRYPFPYLSCACAIGMSENDVDLLCKRLDRVLTERERKANKSDT